jgi:hypothetical protein
MTTPVTHTSNLDRPNAHANGRRIADRYQVHEPLGRGGMGRVYRAHDTLLNRGVAVKLIYGDAVSDAELQRACATEARAAARLNHPGIVRILDSGVDDGQCYVVMELAAGLSLADILAQRGPLPVAEALPIARQAADALQAAHDAGVIHCDVKPANLMVSEDGRVQLVDFGIARVATATTGLLDATLQGSARYVAPEQVEGGKLDGRTDVYALGVVLYEMLTGQAPFDGGSLASILARRLVVDPPPLHQYRPDVPPGLEMIVLRALARVPADRYASAGEFREALDGARAEAAAPMAVRGRAFGGALTRMVPVNAWMLDTLVRAADRLAALRPRTVAVLAAILAAGVLASMAVARIGGEAMTAEAATTSPASSPPANVAVDLTPLEAAPTSTVLPAVVPPTAAPAPSGAILPPATQPVPPPTTIPAPTSVPAIEAVPHQPPAEPVINEPPVAARSASVQPAPDSDESAGGSTGHDPADDRGDDDRDGTSERNNDGDEQENAERERPTGPPERPNNQRAPKVEVLKGDPPPSAPKPNNAKPEKVEKSERPEKPEKAKSNGPAPSKPGPEKKSSGNDKRR